MIDKLTTYLQNNPYKIYGDYETELPDDTIHSLLSGNIDTFQDVLWEHDINLTDYFLDDVICEACQECNIFLSNLTEEEKQDVYSSVNYDTEDYWKTALNNTNPNIVITLLNNENEPIYFPHMDNNNELNLELDRYLQNTLGIDNPQDAETTYPIECLKLCGKLNLLELYKHLLANNKLPETVTITPDDNDQLLCHDSYNGSGSMGCINVTKSHEFKYTLTLDNDDSYGIDAVYGLTRSFWNNPINLIKE